jgi:hypothetical protein
MQCPVCSQKCENLTPATLEGVVVGCGNCGVYRISGHAYDPLMRLEPARRAGALAAAKLVSRHGWPMIDAACVNARGAAAA